MYIKGHVSIHRTKDQSNACMCENDVKGVKRSLNSFNCYSCYSSQELKVVFAAFTQHCIELLNFLLMSTGLKVYSVYSGLSPLPGGKAIV